MKKLQLRVIPNSLRYLNNAYKVQWRFDMRVNWFNSWSTVTLYSDALNNYQTMPQHEAIELAQRIRKDPDVLLDLLKREKAILEARLARAKEMRKTIYV